MTSSRIQAVVILLLGAMLLVVFFFKFTPDVSSKPGPDLYPVFYRSPFITVRNKSGIEVSRSYLATGYINAKGEIALPPKYSLGGPFYQGVAIVDVGGHCEFINSQGVAFNDPRAGPILPSEIVDLQYYAHFSDGLLRITRNHKCGFVDRTGRVKIPFDFEETDEFHDGICLVKITDHYVDKWGYIRANGSWMANPVELKSNLERRSFSDGYALIRDNQRYWFIDTKGRRKFGPYLIASSFSDGLAWVDNTLYDMKTATVLRKTDDTCGYINTQGEMVLKTNPKEFLPPDFHDGLRRYGSRDGAGYADRQGKFLIVPGIRDDFDFSDGMAAVRIGDLWGFVDTTGKLRVPAIWKSVQPFHVELARVSSPEHDYAYINRDGTVVWDAATSHLNAKDQADFDAATLAYQKQEAERDP